MKVFMLGKELTEEFIDDNLTNEKYVKRSIAMRNDKDINTVALKTDHNFLETPKRYKLNMEKVISIKSTDEKLNAIFKIFYLLNMSIDENLVCEELRPFLDLIE